MRYLYVCPTCRKAYSAEGERPELVHECLVCNSRLIYTNLNKDEWDMKTEEEKTAIKESVLQSHTEAEMSTEGQLLHCMKNLDKNVATIKNILVFFTIVFIVCAIITLIMDARAASFYNDFLDGIRFGY